MNNKLFFGFISVVEKVLHLIILGMVIFLCFEEVMSAVNGGGVRVESVLMLFIYLEIMQMVNIFLIQIQVMILKLHLLTGKSDFMIL